MDELIEAMLALETAVAAVRSEAAGLDELGEPPDYADLVRIYTSMGDLGYELRQARADVGEAAHHAMPSRYASVEGVGDVEKSWGLDRKGWEHDALLDLILARSRDERKADEKTGEYESEVEAFKRVLRDCAGFSYWKVGKKEEGTGLRGRGIDPSDYCREEPKRVSIDVPSPAKRAEATRKAAAKLRGAPDRPLEASLSAATAPDGLGEPDDA